MIFPFSIKYTVELVESFTAKDNKKTLEFIEEYILKKTGEDIVVEENKLTFKTRFFSFKRGKSNILAPIEKGVFVIVAKGDRTLLTYEFYMFRLFVIVTIMSIFTTIFSQKIGDGVYLFLWLGGLNWIITIIRHKRMLNEIKSEINKLIINSKN